MTKRPTTVMPLLELGLLLAIGCVHDHFATVARSAAASPPGCAASGAVVVTRLREWAYQVDACGEVSYVRCSFAYNTGGEIQCCAPTTRAEAVALVAPDDLFHSTCELFGDDGPRVVTP